MSKHQSGVLLLNFLFPTNLFDHSVTLPIVMLLYNNKLQVGLERLPQSPLTTLSIITTLTHKQDSSKMEHNAPKPAIFFFICSCFLLVLLLLTTSNQKALAASSPVLSSSSAAASQVCDQGTNDSNSTCHVEAAAAVDESLLEMVLMATGDDGVRRRFVQERDTQRYITPGALKKDKPVCNGGSSGQAYSSSCLPPPSNPHTRGCFKYYRCRSDS